MKLITRQSRANEAAQRWKTSYFHETAKHWQYGATEKEKIYNALIALGTTPNPDDVDKVIGNGSWTEVGECNECGKKSEALIMLGEEPDYDSHTASICLKCIEKATIQFCANSKYNNSHHTESQEWHDLEG